METSSSMDIHNQWKWINKAAQKFIRYDLPLHSNLAIVTFSNNSRVAHVMSAIHSEEARARLADTVPDKYHLAHTDVKCLLCGVQQAIQEVKFGFEKKLVHCCCVHHNSVITFQISGYIPYPRQCCPGVLFFNMGFWVGVNSKNPS